MADPRFFPQPVGVTLAEIARISGAELADPAKGETLIKDAAPLDRAGPDDLSFLDNIRYRRAFRETGAGACFVAPAFAGEAPEGTAALVTKAPYRAYALAAQYLYPEAMPPAAIAPGAYVAPEAVIGEGCCIEPGAVVMAGAEIGEGSWVESGAVIREGVVIGRKCRIGAGASVSHALIGDSVRLYPGVRIGQDGFGFAMGPRHLKVPQLGRVVIGDHVEIGANTCIDRGAGPDTVIGSGTWIDNLVQIGHNVNIGQGCVIVAQVGISGSTVLGDYVVLAGQAGVAGHLRIGSHAQVGAQSGVMRDIPSGEKYLGSPALPHRQFMKQVAYLKKAVKDQGE